jgi:hypothetical protein
MKLLLFVDKCGQIEVSVSLNGVGCEMTYITPPPKLGNKIIQI